MHERPWGVMLCVCLSRRGEGLWLVPMKVDRYPSSTRIMAHRSNSGELQKAAQFVAWNVARGRVP